MTDHFVDGAVPDRRFVQRYKVETALRVRVRAWPEQTSQAENLSDHGVFFATNLDLKVGTRVDLLLRMPEEISGVPINDCLYTGHVVRVERINSPRGQHGVSVQFDCYEVSRPKAAEILV